MFFPDTMTTTHPGSLAAQASAAQRRQHCGPTASSFPPTAAPWACPPPRCLSRARSALPVPPARPGRPARYPSCCPPRCPPRLLPRLTRPVRAGPGRRSAASPAGPPPAPVRAPAGRPGADAEHDFPWATPPATVTDPPARPPGRGDLPSAGSFSPSGAPFPGGYAGAGPQPPSQYHGAPLPAGQRKPPADGAGQRPVGRRPGWRGLGRRTRPARSGRRRPAPAHRPHRRTAPRHCPRCPCGHPARSAAARRSTTASPGPAGGPIDAVPWLSGPGAPPSVRRPVPGNPVPVGPLSAGLGARRPAMAGPGSGRSRYRPTRRPTGPGPAGPPYRQALRAPSPGLASLGPRSSATSFPSSSRGPSRRTASARWSRP